MPHRHLRRLLYTIATVHAFPYSVHSPFTTRTGPVYDRRTDKKELNLQLRGVDGNILGNGAQVAARAPNGRALALATLGAVLGHARTPDLVR